MIQEQIIREVAGIGNGAHIFVPKCWLNQKVLVRKMPDLTLKERILKALSPYLDNIIAVFLYGSYARGEQEKESDIDILVVAKKKFRIKNRNKLSFEVIEYSKLEENIKSNPLMFYPIIQEAKPILNSFLLEELKKIKFDSKAHIFKWFIDSTKDHIKSNKELIEMDKIDGIYLTSHCVLYSIILRLRGIFLIKTILSNKIYTKGLFKNWLTKNALNIDYKKIYAIYKAVRDKNRINLKIELSQVETLLAFLKKEIDKLEAELNG